MLQSFNVLELIEKTAVKSGNSAMIVVPKKWLGKNTIVLKEKKSLNLAKEILQFFEPFLKEIEAAFYLPAKNKTLLDSLKIFLISSKKINKLNFFNQPIYCFTKEQAITSVKKNQLPLNHNILIKCQAVLNKPLLDELKAVKI